MNINKINCFGTYLALLILITSILIFLFRLRGNPRIEYWLGMLFLLTSIPIVFLLLTAKNASYPTLNAEALAKACLAL
jgi:hypothetical protein